MSDLAVLGIKVDASEVDPAVSSLDKLTASGTRAEKATDGIARSSETASQAAAKMAADAQKSAAGLGKLGSGGQLTAFHMRNLAFQMNDLGIGMLAAANSGEPLKMAFMVLAQQGSQISGIMSQAGVGVGGLVKNLVMAHPILTAVAVVAGVVSAAIGFMTSEVNKNSAVHVTWADTALGAFDAVKSYLGGQLSAAFEAFGTTTGEVWENVKIYAKNALNFVIGAITLVPRIAIESFSTILPAIGDGIISAVNAVIRGLNTMVSVAVRGINALISTINSVLPNTLAVATITAPQIAEISNSYAGAGSKWAGAMSKAFKDTVKRDWIGDAADAISPFAQARARKRMEDDAKKAGGSAGKAAGKAMGDELAKEADKFLAELNKAMLDGFGQITVNMAEALKGSTDSDWSQIFADARKETEAWLEPQGKMLENQAAFNEELERLKDIAGSIDFGSVFGRGGDAIDGMISSMDRLTAAQKAYGDAQYAADQLTGPDRTKAKAEAEKEYNNARLNGTIAFLGASKNLFSTQSAGYKAITAFEKAFAAIKLVNTIKAMVMDTTHTASSVANSTVRATADQAAGASKMFSILGPFAFPVVAAMIALLAGLGVKGGSGAASYKPPSAEQMQESTGTGTVLGDSSAKSASIENALGIMAANSNKDLEYSNNMVGYLRSISSGIGALTTAISRQLGLGSGGSFSTSNFNLGSNSGGGVLGLFSTTTTRSIYDQGLETFGQTVSEILAEGVQAQVYNVIEQVKKNSGFLGIGGSTKTTYETVTGQIPAQIESQFNLIIKDITNSVIAYADQLGTDVSGAIGKMQIEPARLSFAGMTGDEIQKSLEAYFSSVADHLAGALDVSGLNLESLQKAGEGLYETLARVTRTMMTVTSSLSSIGMSLDSVGGNYSVGAVAPARDALVNQFGGLDAFQEAISAFSDKFLTDAEKMQPVIAAVNAEMARLGESGVTTKDQFKALVQGLDLSTDAGQQMFASLMSVAPAFAKVDDYLTKLNATTGEATKTLEQLAAIEKQRQSLQIDLMTAQGDTAGALAAKRASELAAMDGSLRSLQQLVWDTQDATKAQSDLAAAQKEAADTANALAKLHRGLEIELMEATGNAAGALAAKRQDELAALDASLRPIKEQIYAAQDAAVAAEALADAQKAQAEVAAQAASEAAALMSQKKDLEIQYMEAKGNAEVAVALQRAKEMAALDASLRPLQRAIYAAEDAAKAQEALAEAQAAEAETARKAADDAIAIASQRAGLEIALLRATGKEVEAVNLERARELATLPEVLRGLQQQIYTANDATAAANALSAAQAEQAATAKAIAAERHSLEIRLLDATGDSVASLATKRADELAATNEVNRSLLGLIYAAEDAKKASDALAAAEKTQAEATAQAAQAAMALAKERANLEIRLMDATGDSVSALAAKRAQEMDAADESLRSLLSAIYAAEDASTAARAAADALADAQKLAEQAAKDAADAQAAATKVAEDAAKAAKDLADKRASIEIELMQALGDASGALAAQRALELAALDPTLRAIKEQIYAAEDATTAANAAAEAQAVLAATQAAAADAAAKQAEQRRSLEIALAEALGNTAEALSMRRADELAALDESLRGIQSQIYAAEDAAQAAQALADAQGVAADAARAQAEAEANLAEQRRGLEIELAEALGNSSEALAMRRADELAAMDGSLRGLKEQIYAAEDAAKAAEDLANAQSDAAQAAQELADKTAAIAEEQQGLMIRYYEAAGNSAAALALRREQELASTDESNRALLLQIYALEDAKTAQDAYSKAVEKHNSTLASARDALSSAYDREAGALRDTIKQFGDFGDSLRKFRAGLFAADQGSSASYRQLQVDFIKTAALAATGDKGGLGGLEGSGSAFLDASRAQSSSLVQYQRDVAMVARSVDTAIAAADSAVDYAQAQLDALTQLVGGYIDLNKTEISVLEAINQLRTAMADDVVPATVLPIVTTQQEQTEVIRDGNTELKAEVVSLKVALAQSIAALTDKVASIDRREAKYDQGTHKAIGGVGTETVPVDTTP